MVLKAEHALKELQLLYRIEQACNKNGYYTERRLAERQQKAKPIMDALKVWMETEGLKYSSCSLIGKAVNSAYRKWDNMMCYLNDGRIHIDNNLAENAIRPITLGRKISYIAKMPYLQKASHEELLELLPHNWKHANNSN